MAVTANQITKRQGGDNGRVKVPVAASKRLYGGTLCFLDAGGDASDVINTDVGLFCGIVVDEVNNTGADAAISVEVWTEGVFELPMSGADLVLADLGKTVYAVDNYSLSETGANQPVVGTIVGIVSTSVARVSIKGLGNGIMVAPT